MNDQIQAVNDAKSAIVCLTADPRNTDYSPWQIEHSTSTADMILGTQETEIMLLAQAQPRIEEVVVSTGARAVQQMHYASAAVGILLLWSIFSR